MANEQSARRISKACEFRRPDPKTYKNETSFWILGFNSQFGYLILLTAAQDIIHNALSKVEYATIPRNCCAISTGIVLLSVSVLTVIVQWLQAQFTDCFEFFSTISMACSGCGYFMLAFGNDPVMGAGGVLLVALGYCIGDYEICKRAALYEHKIAKRFRKGNDCSVLLTPILYTSLRLCGIETIYIFLSFIALPILAMCVLWLILTPPLQPKLNERADSEYSLAIFREKPTLIHMQDKMEYTGHIIRSVFPLILVYICQGITQQGLYEFIYFRHNFIDINCQYILYICGYSVGFYACLETRNLLLIHYVSICVVLQVIASSFLIFDALFFIAGYLWCIVLIVYIQGIIAGVAYTSTLEHIWAREPIHYLDLAEAIMKKSIHAGLIVSGIIDIGIHYYLSRRSEPNRP